MKKKLIVVSAIACMLALALAGCASSSSGSSASQSASSSSASASAASAQASASSTSAPASSASVGMANPWRDVETSEAAAEGAGLSIFDVPEGITMSLGKVPAPTYRCMDGIAQATYEFPAVEITIRKGTAAAANGTGDISGDYTEYANTWTQNIKGLNITCFGNREGEATKTIWQVGDNCWSINAKGLGGDTDFGLQANDLQSLIMAMQ